MNSGKRNGIVEAGLEPFLFYIFYQTFIFGDIETARPNLFTRKIQEMKSILRKAV